MEERLLPDDPGSESFYNARYRTMKAVGVPSSFTADETHQIA